MTEVHVRGTCPSLPAPMATGDGLLVRLVVNAPIPLDAFIGLCAAARTHGWALPGDDERAVLEVPRETAHGDVATNLAMLLARAAKRPPREIAQKLADALPLGADVVARVEIAGPGFLNLHLTDAALAGVLRDVLAHGADYGRSDAGRGLPVQVEFVSANPTGPMNVVNARAAAVGNALVRILGFAGYEASFHGVGSDDDGMRVEELEGAEGIRLIYAVPEFHNPKGTTLSAERRKRLVRIAAERRLPVIEDDAYGELRFRGQASPPLMALDEAGRRLMVLGGDTKLRFYDVASRTQLGDPIDIAFDVADGDPGAVLRPDGLQAAADTGQGVLVWDLDPARWVDAACQLASRNLTHAEWDHYIGDLAPYRATCPQFPTD